MTTKRDPWWDRLNARLFPWIGPPPLGPYDQEPLPDPATKACPLCGSPMGEHRYDRGEGRPTYLRCPTETAAA